MTNKKCTRRGRVYSYTRCHLLLMLLYGAISVAGNSEFAVPPFAGQLVANSSSAIPAVGAPWNNNDLLSFAGGLLAKSTSAIPAVGAPWNNTDIGGQVQNFTLPSPANAKTCDKRMPSTPVEPAAELRPNEGKKGFPAREGKSGKDRSPWKGLLGVSSKCLFAGSLMTIRNKQYYINIIDNRST
jgi:hypothetical protein